MHLMTLSTVLNCSDNVLPEEPPGARGQDVVQDGPAARALPGDGHPGGVTPKVEDVLLHPVEGELLVPETLSTAGEPWHSPAPPVPGYQTPGPCPG